MLSSPSAADLPIPRFEAGSSATTRSGWHASPTPSVAGDTSMSHTDATVAAEALLAALNGYAFHAMLDVDFDFGGHARRLLHARITRNT